MKQARDETCLIKVLFCVPIKKVTELEVTVERLHPPDFLPLKVFKITFKGPSSLALESNL